MFVLLQLEDELTTAIHILDQALKVTEDMVLPSAPSLLSEPKKTAEQTEQEKPSGEAGSTSEECEQGMEVDVTDNKAESEGDAKNGSDDCNGSNTVEKMDTTTNTEEVFKVKKEDIIAQVCAHVTEI